MSERVLLVEDDENLGRQIAGQLRNEGLAVDWLKDGDTAITADFARYELVILDLMLPGAYGLDVLRRLREDFDIPVLILSARNESNDKVRALQLGADDYVTKPFWPEELIARVRARLRRPVLQRESILRAGPLALDLSGRRVEVDGSAVTLTNAEFEILAGLTRRVGCAVTRAWLAESLEGGTERTLDVHVSRLRKKLGSAGKQIKTVWNIGYRLDAETDA